METVVRRIRVFHTLFLICCAGMFLSFCLSVFLFFYLDIREILRLFTGAPVKKEGWRKKTVIMMTSLFFFTIFWSGMEVFAQKEAEDLQLPQLTEVTFTDPVTAETGTETRFYYDQDAQVQFSVTEYEDGEAQVEVTVYQRRHRGDFWVLYEEPLGVTKSESGDGNAYSFTMPSQEMEYFFTVSYEDEILYTSSIFVKDVTPPVYQAAYNKEPEIYNSEESIETTLTIQERNLDLEKTFVKISAKDIHGEKIQAKELESFLYDEEQGYYIASFADLQEGGTVSLPTEDSLDVYTATLLLKTEANYEVCVEIRDKVEQRAVYTKKYTIDRTAPEVAIVTEGGNFTRVLNKGTYQYFTRKDPVIQVELKDYISGAAALKTVCFQEEKEIENYEVSEPEMEKEDQSVLKYVITLPMNFKGTLWMQGTDHAKNVDEDGYRIGLIAETESMHRQLASNKIEILTKAPKTPFYYPGDVIVKFISADGHSGFYQVNYQAGGDVETISYPEGEEICLEAVREYLISSALYNTNHIPLALGFEDLAGHEAVLPPHEIPQIHIDTTTPQIHVSYDQMEGENEKYYKEPRTARVTITERNFDPEDTKLEITGPDTPISQWKHIPGSGCRGSSNPKDTFHTDECRWECQIEFREDGDYRFTCSTVDLAGNKAHYGQVDEFVIDQTIPEIKVTYDNHDVRNGYFYKRQRVAVIEITEHNFDASDVSTARTAQLEGENLGVSAISSWSGDGDVHRATIAYNYDADFTFDISYRDLAGNEAADYEEDRFTVDLTAPEIKIYDIENFSANNDVAAPGIKYSDVNYDADGTELFLSGYRNGMVQMTGVRKITAKGVDFKLKDFDRVPQMDDMYTMNVVVDDLAGNRSEASVLFSVNRFGSVYTFDEKTEALVGEKGSYYTRQEQELVVRETNVDTLEFQEIILNLNGKLKTLVKNQDYYVDEDGSETGWKQYTYHINKDNFREEGLYALTIYSEDRAENTSANNTKGKKIEFVVDKTSPSVVITGVEHEKQYREKTRTVILDVEDGFGLGQVKVLVNGEAKVYTGNGKITLTIGSSNHWQTLKVYALDGAGNVTETEELTFLITPNIFVQFYRNQPVFYGTIGITVLLFGCTWFAFAKKKQRSNN